MIDRERGIWWCNLEAGEGDALWALSLKTGQPLYQSPDGTVAFNRNFALARDGAIYFNGDRRIGKCDLANKEQPLTVQRASFDDSPGMRSSTRQTRDGRDLWRHPRHGAVSLLPARIRRTEAARPRVVQPQRRLHDGVYAVPDEPLRVLPATLTAGVSRGDAGRPPEIATGRQGAGVPGRGLRAGLRYVPPEPTGLSWSADGGTLYVNFNGHPTDSLRPELMKPIGLA